MQKAKTGLFFFVVTLFSFFIAPLTVAYADSPPPPSYFYTYVTNANSNVKHIDILIKISKSSKYYTDLNTSNASAYGFNSTTPIVTYNQGGYMSISFHCNNVYSNTDTLQEDSGLNKIIELNNGFKPISTMTDSIKIALTDENGNILKVSNAVNVMPTADNKYPNELNYDARSTTPKVNFVQYYKGQNEDSILVLVIILLPFLIRMAISTTLETLVAIPFKIKPLWKIVAINIATQILLFTLISSGILSYTNAVIVGEIFVFISEFAAYIFLFKHITKPKLALYTVIANTTSLAVGLIFNIFHVFIV